MSIIPPTLDDQVLDAFALGVKIGAEIARGDADALDCHEIAVDRIEVYPDTLSPVLEGVTYACEQHALDTLAAIAATGACPDRCRVGEREPQHTCGQVINYAGAVIL